MGHAPFRSICFLDCEGAQEAHLGNKPSTTLNRWIERHREKIIYVLFYALVLLLIF